MYKLYVDCIQKLVAPQKGSAIPPDLLDKIRMGRVGKSSLSYLKSLIGTPVNEDSRLAEFAAGGYVITARYLGRATAEGPKGTIIGLRVMANGAPSGARAKLIFDGYWNEPEINRNAVLGKSGPKEFRIPDCKPDYSGGPVNSTDPSFYCFVQGYGASNLVNRTFFLEEASQSECLTLILLQRYYRDLRVKEAKAQRNNKSRKTNASKNTAEPWSDKIRRPTRR